MASHPHWTIRKLANTLHVSPGLIIKVRQRAAIGETEPRRHGTGAKGKHFPVENIALLVEMLAVEEPGHTYTIKDVQKMFTTEFGERWSISVLNKSLRQEYSRQKAIFEDPRKWSAHNCQLIENFLIWRIELPLAQHYAVKVFDECRVDRTNLGQLIIWSRRGQRPVRERYRRDVIVESWTVTILTLLDDSYPLVYTVTPKASNGDKFLSFIEACLPYIFAGDIILGDNCSFHQQGWSAEVARITIEAMGAQYKLLPKYCPEWSPAERVFSYLKALLRTTFNAKDDLLFSIVRILNKVSIPLMLSWYEGCGWLN